MRKFKIKIELANKVARPKKSTLSPFFLDLSMRRMPHTPKIKLKKPIRDRMTKKLPSSPSGGKELIPVSFCAIMLQSF